MPQRDPHPRISNLFTLGSKPGQLDRWLALCQPRQGPALVVCLRCGQRGESQCLADQPTHLDFAGRDPRKTKEDLCARWLHAKTKPAPGVALSPLAGTGQDGGDLRRTLQARWRDRLPLGVIHGVIPQPIPGLFFPATLRP